MQTTYSQKTDVAQRASDSSAESLVDLSSQGESLQRKADMANGSVQREEHPNNTGMPDNLKAGIESLSGFSMDDVRVHYNSSKPATVQALAYTQGTDIHVAPGQEKHLPHEAWHVAQQMAGRVSPTTNINGMPVNDNAALEHEADVMGEKAVQCKSVSFQTLVNQKVSNRTIQCLFDGAYPHLCKAADVSRSVVAFAEHQNSYPLIAFESMAGVGKKENGSDRSNELVDLYNDVISRYLGRAHVYMGVNAPVEEKAGTESEGGGAKKKGKTVTSNPVNDAKTRAIESAENVFNRINGVLKEGHEITVIPFVFLETCSGGYSFPFMEARHLIMSEAEHYSNAEISNAVIYRWIDSDVKDDASIDVINKKKNGAFNPYSDDNSRELFEKQAFVYSGFYKWGDDRNLFKIINRLERAIRARYWYEKGYLKNNIRDYPEKFASSKPNDRQGYIPEPISYMTSLAHSAAMANLAAEYVKTKYREGASQQRESDYAFDGLNMVFVPDFSVSKPLKTYFNALLGKNEPNGQYDYDDMLKIMPMVHQSAYENWGMSDDARKEHLEKFFKGSR